MEDIQTVAILGAGALGAMYAALFSDRPGFSVSLIARDGYYDRLKRDGLVVNGRHYAVPVVHPDEVNAPADLVLVALKHHQLVDAVGDLRPFVGSDTVILSVMNGLDSEAMIGAVCGMDRVLYCISLGMDPLREGNTVNYTTPGRLVFGEVVNDPPGERVRRVQAAFDRAGIRYETPVDMLRMLWWKFLVNVGVNQATAVLGIPYGVMQTSPDAQAVMEALMREVIDLARASGVNLTEQDIDNWYPVLNTLSPQGKTSMLQDLEAGRKTEVEIFAGKAVELGHTFGIPTPVNQAVLHIIRVLEQRNEARAGG
jgi:2-dehydropantoate 2-reductase